MLRAMSRFALLALLIACGNGSKSASNQEKAPEVDKGSDWVAPPPAKGGPTIGGSPGGATDGSAAPTEGMSPGALSRVANPQFHLKPEEGTLTIAKVEAKAGSPVTAEIKLAPGSGYKLATDFPIKLQLEQPTGVKLDKTNMKAGGRNKEQGDAATLSEQSLAFAVPLTPEAAGTYEIKGVFTFGVCEKDSCHPRTQPITIQVAAN